jgi:hypothetical protein
MAWRDRAGTGIATKAGAIGGKTPQGGVKVLESKGWYLSLSHNRAGWWAIRPGLIPPKQVPDMLHQSRLGHGWALIGP